MRFSSLFARGQRLTRDFRRQSMPTVREPPPHLSLQASYAVTPSSETGQASDSPSPARPSLVVHPPLANRWSQTHGTSEETHPQIVDVTMDAGGDEQPGPRLEPRISPLFPSTELAYGRSLIRRVSRRGSNLCRLLLVPSHASFGVPHCSHIGQKV